MATATLARKGGAWLIEDVAAGDVLTPERLSDEHRLIARTAADFVRQEVAPMREALEGKDWSIARRLVRRAGELGLLATDVPEDCGGLALDKMASALVALELSADPSFATTYGAMTGLAIMPLVAFGTVVLSLVSGWLSIAAVAVLAVVTAGFLFLVPRWWPAQ